MSVFCTLLTGPAAGRRMARVPHVRRDRRRPRVVRALPPGLGPRRPGPPGPGAARTGAPARRRLARSSLRGRSPSTTSPACGPGTARSSSRWSSPAYDARRRPAGRAVACSTAFRRWAPGVDRVHARSGSRPTSTCTSPIPVLPGDTPGHAGRRRASATATAIRLVLVDDEDDRYWLGEHRVVDEFADPTTSWRSTSALLTACWAWERDRARTRRSPASSTPSCALDPPSSGARVVARTDAGEAQRRGPPRRAPCVGDARPPTSRRRARRRRGRTARGARSARPCLAMNRGDDAAALLADALRRARPPDVLEEGRLGGVSWGMGRGAAPPHVRHAAATASTGDVAGASARWHAAMAAWPMLMPPSFGGIRSWTSTSQPGVGERLLDDLGEADVLEHAAGEGDGVEAALGRQRCGQRGGGAADRLVERRPRARASARRASRSATSAATQRRRVEHDDVAVAASIATRPSGVAPCRLARSTVRASASSSIAACAS